MPARLVLILLLLASVLLPAFGGGVALAAPLSQSTPDPGSFGPRAVTRTGYEGGDSFFVPTGWTRAAEMRARVSYPTNLNDGPYPLLIFLHGQHDICFSGATVGSFVWPCAPGNQSLPNFLGYDYLGDLLASQGFIVVSISANGINAVDDSQSTDVGMRARGELVLAHLDLWAAWNASTTGAFGSLFTGKVNMSQIGLMGHSRGGEGVVRAFQLNAARSTPHNIRAVFPLAPVDFNRFLINNVPLAVLLPYCDGDVSDLQGLHFYDDTRYNVGGDTAAKHNILVMGANHNFYNTVWTPGATPGGSDDWLGRESFGNPAADDPHCNPNVAGNGRLSASQQRATGMAYIAAFFRIFLRQETAFARIMQGDVPPPASAATPNIHISYHAPGAATTRRDINRLFNTGNLTTNTMGGAVTTTNIGFAEMCGGDSPEPIHCLGSTTDTAFDREPHTGLSRLSNRRGLSQLSMRLPNPAGTVASYRNAIPAGQGDVSGFAWLQFRASTVWGNSLNPAGVPQNFSVVLTDSAGRSGITRVAPFSNALFYPPGTFAPVLPKVVLNMVRLQLVGFSGVDLHNVRSVEFRFDQTATSWLLISDLAFSNPVPAIASIDAVGPAGGVVGAPVNIFGSNLRGVTAVRFNGTSAPFTVNSTAHLTATVPASATSGPISVVTSLGTVTSPSNFSVYVASGNVGVDVERQAGVPPSGGPILRATFTARATCGPITQIQFGMAGQPLDNARVFIASPAGGPSNQTAAFTYTPPGNTTSVQIGFQRVAQADDATINPIYVSDGCGSWQTFVGGGRDAFR